MIAQIVGKVVDTLLASNARMATKFLDTNKVVRATRQFKRKALHSRTTLILTVGAPNYRERHFIKQCLKSGVPFPVRKIQLKLYPKRKAA